LQVQTSTLQPQAPQQALPLLLLLLLAVLLPPAPLPLQQQQVRQASVNAAYLDKQSTLGRQLPMQLCSCSCRCGMPSVGSCKSTLTRS
jgi:hypothetical protein